ncbi:MAG: FAD-dependent oxidoreductase [Gammaproteobacteria bacterium]
MQRGRQARRIYPFSTPPEISTRMRRHVPVIVVGAGPVGLALAKELANQRIACVVLERDNQSNDGSRAICWSKRTLEICARLKIANRMVAKGVTWNIGRVYCGNDPAPLYSFDLLPTKEQKFPAFVNLQQYYTEEYLVDALVDNDLVDLRWCHTATGVSQHPDHVVLDVDTPAGRYQLTCDYLIAADGCRSTIRALLGLDFVGRTFEDTFLIADVRLRASLPAERRFFFNAPFNDGRTVLIHSQPDDLWRIDFQLGRHIDDGALKPENVLAKVQAALGAELEFDFEWVSLYTFQCRRIARLVHERIIFAGDAAHLVSPFGARGANGGIQDVDNLGWKLAHVLRGDAGPTLLDSYNEERIVAADENIANSTRATDFMTPNTSVARAFRDAVLELAADFPFARELINSGRLSIPCSLAHSSLITADSDAFSTPDLAPGTVALDAPISLNGNDVWLMDQLGIEFVCLYFADRDAAEPGQLPPRVRQLVIRADSGLCVDYRGLVRERYDGQPGTTYLIRPDQHVAARWRTFEPAAVAAAWRRSLSLSATHAR